MRSLKAIIVSCLVLLTSPAWATPSEATSASSESGYLIHLKSADLQKFGLYYPVTYKFKMPPGASGLAAQYRYAVDEVWQELPEKMNGELFNGIDAVRFDYGGGFAYASIRFSRLSDSIYLRFIDTAGQAVAVQFNSLPRYYDDRQAVVTITLDDWGSWSDSAFRAASDYLGSYGLYFTVGLITNSTPWSSVQQKIDQHGDKLEIASHGANHVCNAADYATSGYQAEIVGSRDAIRKNLQYGSNPYVPVYIEPCAYYDATLGNWVSAGDYLLTRGTNYTAPFVAWNPLLGRYGRAGVTFGTYQRADDANLLSLANAAFDDALAAGNIYHLTDHPQQGLWYDNSNLLQHLDHIKGRNDVWYVPLGPFYQYHYVQEMRGDLAIQDLGDPFWAASFIATPSSGRVPLAVTFSDTTSGTNTAWQWDFGDSSSSSEPNPLHVYATAGSYTVKLTVTGPSGISTAQTNIQVSPPPVEIVAPSNNSVLAAQSSIQIVATASADQGATISKVEFFSGTTLLGSATIAPYIFLWSEVPAGNYSLTAKATDSLGVVTTSRPIAIRVINNSLPTPWLSQDIGSVGISGRSDLQNGTFAISGAGSDIWGSLDSFYFVFQPMTGDGQIIARIGSLQNTDPSAKSGVMIRETLSADSAYAMMALSPGKPANFQRRLNSGAFYIPTGGTRPNVTAPYWVKLVRNGNIFSGYISADGTNWTMVESDIITMADSVYIGIPVTSHVYGTLCTASVDNVSVSSGTITAPRVTISTPVNGASFVAPANITVTATATAFDSATVSRVEFYEGLNFLETVTSSPYSFTWNNVTAGKYTLTAKVTDSRGATGTSGPVEITVVDFRSPSVSISAPANGASFNSFETVQITVAATAGTGATINRVEFYNGSSLIGTAIASPYGFLWNNVAAGNYTLTARVIDSQGAMATSSPISIAVVSSTLPNPWRTQDIGGVGVAGSASYQNGTFVVNGAGYDIWGTTDAFRYVFQSLTGDGQIVARVASIQNTDP
ncbi:MAG TPA: Ig-like domain-containing protein, partial [Desulfuromonadaceae bacterium]